MKTKIISIVVIIILIALVAFKLTSNKKLPTLCPILGEPNHG